MNCMNLLGPPTIDPLECMGKNLVFNNEDHPVKATIEKALGDKKYSVRLGDNIEKIITCDQIIHAMNRGDENGQNSIERDQGA